MTNPDAVSTALAELTHLLEGMQRALENENNALKANDTALLQASSNEKSLICERLADPRFGRPLVEAIDELGSDDRERCEAAHKNALELADRVKDLNLVNGMALNRAHNSVREIINIIGGKHLDGLYGETGHASAQADSSGAIAKA